MTRTIPLAALVLAALSACAPLPPMAGGGGAVAVPVARVASAAMPAPGTISAVLDGRAAQWTTFGGSADATARFALRDGAVTLTIIGTPAGDPLAQDGLLRLTARVDGPLAAGTDLGAGRVALIDGRRFDAPRLVGRASLTIERLTRDGASGTIAGTFSGALCRPEGRDATCPMIEGRFETGVQFDGL